MQPFEIHNAEHRWGNCADMRPWLLIGQPLTGHVEAFPISGQCYGGYCYELNPAHPDFAATGLLKMSFVHYSSIIILPVSAFRKHRGVLSGPLLNGFITEAGI